MKDIEKFIGGFRRFQHKYFGEDTKLFESLKRRQKPKTLLIGCSDSRVDPAILTDCDPGDLFVVRNVANLVPPFETGGQYHGVSAAIEYAVKSLKVRQIVVMGHSACGGIGALMAGDDASNETDFIGSWVSIANPAKQQVLAELDYKSPEAQVRACELAAIIVSLDNLMSFPFVAERVAAGELALIGWYFDIQQGALFQFNPDVNAFEAVVEAPDNGVTAE
ncbi:carbonic anhydrase [Jeongeupia naejangsanensis]|uniref:Carbonic anhydrase n=1 Tax=Jeongeupia naejangsanensis TaxID=613195 RepID=A0ABS2BMV4_9NEIS|nr:carbonic anhydrase [Jeongeupia naejangsanensis]MBM3116955.1 carbonic anhydrase [Jeongeupia naejangsanensis]